MKKNEKLNNNSNIKNIKIISDITKDSFTYSGISNTFTVFTTINNFLYLIYSDKNNSIICFNLNNSQKICEIKKPHTTWIGSFIHYLDIKNKRDLIISISCYDNNIILWNVNNWECIVNIKKVNEGGRLLSACFLNDNNNIYIASSNHDNDWVDNTELIKIFDFNGNIVKKINKSNEMTFFIYNFYDKKTLKNYILTGNKDYIKSYDYYENKLFLIYYDNYNDDIHNNLLIYEQKDDINLIDSCYDGYIRIWNFYTGKLLNKIKISNEHIRGICLWNDDYLIVGCSDNYIKLIELKNNLNITNLEEKVEEIITIKKINHYLYGECLLTQGLHFEQIKIWGFKE